MGIVVVGAIFIDVKGYPLDKYIPGGRNVGRVEQVHGGVSRNIAEDIANLELRPTFVSVVDDSGLGKDAIAKLKNHKVNTDYIGISEDGLGTWLAIFDNQGDVVSSISKRPDLSGIVKIIDEHGDEIFKDCDSIAIEIDMDKEIVKRIFHYAQKYGKQVYAAISNMSIALKRRDLLKQAGCLVCNIQEAGMLFFEDYEGKSPEEMAEILKDKLVQSGICKMVVTMGDKGAAYASNNGEYGYIDAMKVSVVDTTGAGDAFFAGVSVGLTYGKSLKEACLIGNRLASSVICTIDAVCPRFLPSEFGLDVEVND